MLMKSLIKLLTLVLFISSFNVIAKDQVAEQKLTGEKKNVTEYRVRVIITNNPTPTLNRYQITAYVYADNPDSPVSIPSPITVNGEITWNSWLTKYPISITIPTSGVAYSTFDVNKPDTLSSDNMRFVSLSTTSLGGVPVVWDDFYFE